MITVWPAIARSLNASAATLELAQGLTLQRVDHTVLWFASREPVSMTATRKLADSLSQHTGQALTVVIKNTHSGLMQRCYSNPTGSIKG